MTIKSLTGLSPLLLAASGCMSSGVDVPAGAPSGDLLLHALGSGSWRVDCTATTKRGRTAASDIGGSGGESSDVIALRDIISASCDYSADTSPLTLTLEEDGLACPFGTFDEGICRTVIGAGDSGSFDFAPS